MATVKAMLQCTTPFTVVIGPVLPKIAFSSSTTIKPIQIHKPKLMEVPALLTAAAPAAPAPWNEPSMPINMGAENRVLVREAKPAFGAAFAASPGTIPQTIFWFGQIISHTFKNIKVPMRPPIMM